MKKKKDLDTVAKNEQNQKTDCHDKYARLMTLTVKAVVVNDSGKILLLKRAKKEVTNGDLWDLPGGTIEHGETVEEALKREVQEETGLDVRVEEVIRISEFEKSHPCFLAEKRGFRFIARYEGGDDEVVLNEREHGEFGWFDLNEALGKFSDKNGFEAEKKATVLEAKKVLEWKSSNDRLSRLLADFENYKKRTARNNEDFKKYCTEELVIDILPVLDNFEMAIEHAPQEEREKSWMVGITHIYNQLKKLLQDRGVNEIEVKIGDSVDANIHEVIDRVEKAESEGVVKVIKKGYRLGDRIIRPASIQAKE